jgi:endonuclease/exonuclease/phosphatase family metal-dependent hydrolase
VKRICLLLVLTGLASLGASPEGALRLATWNVQNYLLQNRWDGGRYRFEYPKPEADKTILRRLLLTTRPDVLFLQEIGSEAMLGELQEDLAIAGLDYPHVHYSGFPDSRSGLAFLSMLPPAELLFLDPKGSGAHQDSLIRRGVQEVAFDYQGTRIRAFHVHLKSRYTSDEADPDSRRFRAAELAALKEILDDRIPISATDEVLLLLGDFNTPFDSPMLDPMREDFALLEVRDASGDRWTYHYYKTQALEQLDGFWTTPDNAGDFSPIGLFPQSIDRNNASDHRMVVVDWRAGTQPILGDPID